MPLSIAVYTGRGGVVVEGSGLRGMRARLEAIGGSLTLEGSRGLRLTACVPLRPVERRQPAALRLVGEGRG